MATSSDSRPKQAFRCLSTNQVFEIPVRRDSGTGKDIILWRDILSAFENAEVILNGITMVLSLEDDQFVELEPLRIEYHPGVELGVVVRNRDRASSNAEGSSKSRRPRDRNSTFIPTPTPFTPSDTNPQSRTNANNASTTSHPPTASSGQLRQDTESLLLTCKDILGVCLEYVKFGKQAPSSDVNQFMEQQKEMFQEANAKNEDLLKRLVACIQEHQQDTKEGMEKMQQMQREALDTLAIIHSRIQTVLTQTYELHEYLIPRLFIVLPKTDEGLRDKVTGFIAEHYKLYFLCECGSHTTPKGSKTQHEIHLAKHEGYDLDKPTEFFQRYGSYLITMLQMIQYGIVAAGSIVQPMTNHKVVDDLVAVLKSFRKDINPLINSTIKQLQDTQGCKMADTRSSTGQADFDQQEALEGADLRQLMRYLKIKDDGHDLGNLYRIVTEEGHVKWVCIDHYRENYGETLRSRLEDAVKLNGGTFNEATGRIKVTLQSVLQAKGFYDALVKARGTLELDITLKWDATMDEIQALVDAVDKANVVGLTVDGTFFKRAWDFINRKQRFNPFMALASNDRIQYLKLRGFEAFFHRVNQLPSKPYSKLREFSMESGNLLSPRAIKSFEDFIGHRPPLTTLRLTLSEEHSLVKTVEKIIKELERLRLLTIDYGELSVTTQISKGAIQDAELTIRQPADLHSRELDFVIPDNLTRLVITSITQEVEDSQLADILRKYPRLGYLQIGCQGWRAPAAIHLIITTRTSILREGGSSNLRTFELMAEKLVPFDVYGKCNDTTHIQTHVSFAENSSSYEMRTWIRLQNRMHIRDKNPVYDLIDKYGWSIVFLEEDWTYNDTFAAILDHIPIPEIPEKRTLQLETLCFELSKFTDSGFDRLDSVIRRSPNLKLGLRFELVSASQTETVCPLLKRYGSMVFKLQLHGSWSLQWLRRLALLFPTRASFPNLTSFEVSFESESAIPANCIRWIASMISPRALDSAPSSSPQDPSQRDGQQDVDSKPRSVHSWMQTRKIMLSNIALDQEGWRTIIGAMDFTTLQHLDLSHSNLSRDYFSLLVGQIAKNAASVITLETLNIEHTYLEKDKSLDGLESILGKLSEKAPTIRVLTTTTRSKIGVFKRMIK